ncbi:hypothetical protein LN037_30625 [Actinomycetospora sp. SF1]|nr:hypothetical protein [Actinomycetospora soli]
MDIARDELQAHDGLGFTAQRDDDDAEGPVEAICRDSEIGEIYGDANEVQRWVIARQIFGREHPG